jgi:hypothetical protein
VRDTRKDSIGASAHEFQPWPPAIVEASKRRAVPATCTVRHQDEAYQTGLRSVSEDFFTTTLAAALGEPRKRFALALLFSEATKRQWASSDYQGAVQRPTPWVLNDFTARRNET